MTEETVEGRMDPPQTAFTVYTYNFDTGEMLEYVGGSYDSVTSVTIMCALYNVMQRMSYSDNRVLTVYDETTLKKVAFIGLWQGVAVPGPT